MRLLLKPLPDALTLLRLVCAFAFVWALWQHDWNAAFWIMVVGAYTDPLDGMLARAAGLPDKRWFGLTGQAFNEAASGALCVLPPVALMLFPLWDEEQPQSMELWIGLCAVFGLATLWLNWHKNPEREPNPLHREPIVVAQGWLTGLIWVSCGAQVFAASTYSEQATDWRFPALLVVGGILLSYRRWIKRPELFA